MTDPKKTVLIIGGGAVGAIAAVNLEVGGLATVTVVLRSNYNVVKEKGYTIESCDHGSLTGWRPSVGMLQPSFNDDVAFEIAVHAPRLTSPSSQHGSEPHRREHSTLRLCHALHQECTRHSAHCR